MRAARDNYLLHFNKPAKKDAKELKDPKIASALKEAEDSKDEIAVLNILITENPTCSSGTSSKKQPLSDPDNTEKHGDHKNGVDQKNFEHKNGEYKNGDHNNPSVEQKNGEQNRIEQKNGEQNNNDMKNDDNK